MQDVKAEIQSTTGRKPRVGNGQSQTDEECLKSACEVNLGEVPSPASVCGHGPKKMSHLIGTDFVGGELASNSPGIRRKSTEEVDVGDLSGGGNHRVGPSGTDEIRKPELLEDRSGTPEDRSGTLEDKSRDRTDQQIQTEQVETSATDSDKSEPRLPEALMKKVNGLQRKLQKANQGIKKIIRNRNWARKSHSRRERRRAAKQKEVGNHPKFPADCLQTQPFVGDYGNKDEAGTQPPTEDWAPPPEVKQGSGWEREGVGQSEPETSPTLTQPSQSFGFQSCSTDDMSESPEIPEEVNIKRRDACRLIRALRKVSYELRGSRPEKRKPEKRVYQGFITLEDQVGIHHLQHRIGKREELQTTLQHPHQFRKTLVRVYRLKNLRWTLFRVQDGNLTRMPKLMQILEDQAEYVIRIEDYKRRRPNSPGSSKRHHFERANQKRGRKDFAWSPPQKKDPGSPVKGSSQGGHQEEWKESRFTWTAPDTEPQVEPPRPEGWKPLVLTPQTVRTIADEKLKEWSKDQEEYAEQQFQEVQRRKQELKEPRTEVAVDPGSRKAVSEEEEKRAVLEKEALVRLDKRYEDVLFTIQRKLSTVHEQQEVVEKMKPIISEDLEYIPAKKKELENQECKIKEEQEKLKALKDLERRKIQDLSQEELQGRIRAEDERVRKIKEKELELAREKDRRRVEKITEITEQQRRYKEEGELRIAEEKRLEKEKEMAEERKMTREKRIQEIALPFQEKKVALRKELTQVRSKLDVLDKRRKEIERSGPKK
jgi:hypothetical protein